MGNRLLSTLQSNTHSQPCIIVLCSHILVAPDMRPPSASTELGEMGVGHAGTRDAHERTNQQALHLEHEQRRADTTQHTCHVHSHPHIPAHCTHSAHCSCPQEWAPPRWECWAATPPSHRPTHRAMLQRFPSVFSPNPCLQFIQPEFQLKPAASLHTC